LRQEVERAGAIAFARFMELALYCPNSGYYERPECRPGRRGDFYTSVSTGGLFGELLAFQFARWLDDQGAGPIQLVEAGAHDGQLACDVLDWFQERRPDLLDRLEYWLVEPSATRQSWQRQRLDKFAGQVRWAESIELLTEVGVHGVIFSNELLDAFPVHRIAWHHASGQWREWGVGLASSGEQFVWTRLSAGERDWAKDLELAGFELSSALQAVLPDGFIIDFCPAAGEWWRRAAAVLRRGRLLTIDYGLAAHEFLAPERSQGTLRAYHRHRPGADVLALPGEQDLTAHVNFTQLQNAGEAAGLKTEGLLTQAHFLTRIAQALWPGDADAPTPSQARQFKTLTHPEHLGRSFRVLIQSRPG
jgi:SAM-dependent MidA family methyltransferase